MGKGGYKIIDQGGLYYVSFAVVAWVDVFTRKEYRDIVIESLQHCQQKKGLEIYGWCIMSNHAHLIISAKENNVSSVLGDFKKHTSKQIIKAIKEHPGESRREWMLKIFKDAGEENSRNDSYQFWGQDNQPKVIYTEAFAAQKLEYIHNNPVDRCRYCRKSGRIYSLPGRVSSPSLEAKQDTDGQSKSSNDYLKAWLSEF
jgi:REP element-mobilizing transposase RayT